MKYKGIIFDLDGVICTTDKYHYKAWKLLADKLDIDFDEEKNNLLRGVSRMESLNIILGNEAINYSDEEKVVLASEKNENYRNYLSNMTKNDLSADVKETLLTLKEKGYKLAIGSSSKNARYILERLEITYIFDEVVDGMDITNSKPDPEVFLLAQKKLNLTIDECIVVEDAIAGVEAGVNGGFHVFGIGDATTSDKVVVKLEKFSDILKNV